MLHEFLCCRLLLSSLVEPKGSIGCMSSKPFTASTTYARRSFLLLVAWRTAIEGLVDLLSRDIALFHGVTVHCVKKRRSSRLEELKTARRLSARVPSFDVHKTHHPHPIPINFETF